MDKTYMFVIGVTNPDDGTFHLVTLMSRILVEHLTQMWSGRIT